MRKGSFSELLGRERAFPELPEERYVDRLFALLFWAYFGASYASYLFEDERRFGVLTVTLAFAALAAVWTLLPWNPNVPRYRLLAAPMFLAASFVVVYATSFGPSAGLYSIAAANGVFLFGFRRAVSYAGVLLLLILADYLVEYPGLAFGDALEQTAYWVPSFVFVVGICAVAQRAVRRYRDGQELLTRLEAANDELRRYADRVRELAISKERGRMAREIHDTAGHYLAVVNLQLEAATRLLERDPEKLGDALVRARASASEALAEVRRSVKALKPLAMEERTGIRALAALARDFEDTGVSVSFEVEGAERRLSPEAELLLYRALQEGLTNALKHSGASRVAAKLEFAPRAVRLTVSDNGRGVPEGVPEIPKEGGSGIGGLRERAAALGGVVRAVGGDGEGFVLATELPAEVL